MPDVSFAGLSATIVANPLLAGAIIPFAVGAVLAAALRAIQRRRIAAVTMLAVLAAFLLIYLIVEGWQLIPPVTAEQKLFWLALAGAIAGLVVAGRHRAAALDRALLVLLPAAGLLWLGERQWLRGPDSGFVISSVVIWLTSVAILLRLRATDRTARGFATGVQTAVAATGLSLVALAGASTGLAILAGALASGLGGVLVLDYAIYLVNGAPSGLGPVGRLAIANTLLMLAAILLLFSDAVSVIAVAVLALVFLSGRILLRLDRERKMFARIGEPLWAAILAAIPVVIAISIAALQANLVRYP